MKTLKVLSKYISISCLIIFLIYLVSCEKDADNPSKNSKIELSTTVVNEISFGNQNASASLITIGNSSITDHGFCWATTQNPDINASAIRLGVRTTTGTFTSELTSLTANTQYYIRAFATIAGGTLYGAQTVFFTLRTGRPDIRIDSVYSITLNSAYCNSTVIADSGLSVTSRGVCWSTSQNPTILNSHTTDGSGTGSFISNLPGLNPTTNYYVRAYATNSKGTSYGNQVSFVTIVDITAPIVTTATITAITANTAISGGNVTASGGATVTTRGVCWSTSSNPTVGNSHTTDGSGTGTFTSNLTGLTANTQYFVRAYAINSGETAYGLNINFTTNTQCLDFTLTHTAGSTAPVTKTVTYGTVESNLTGENKCWITQNLGADHQATSVTDATEASAGWYWQFNRKQGYKHDGTTRTPNTTWITPIDENSDWLPTNDPCTLLLGSGWRLPTGTEWETANATGGWDNYNETYTSVLKLHAAGFLYDTNGILDIAFDYGFFWSSSMVSLDYGWIMCIGSDYSEYGSFPKASGYSARCLKE